MVDIACAFIATLERMKGNLLLNDTTLLNIKNTRKSRLLLMRDVLIMKATSIAIPCGPIFRKGCCAITNYDAVCDELI